MSLPLQAELDGGTVCPSAEIADPYALRDELRSTDREAIRALVVRTGFFHPEEVGVAVELVDERLNRGAASGYEFILAETDGELAGYACYGPIAGTHGGFDLYWIAVDTTRQRRGLGRLLLRAVEEHVAELGGRRIYADTSGRAQYAPTRSFYERNEFICEARLRDFYAPGDDRVIYGKAVAADSPH